MAKTMCSMCLTCPARRDVLKNAMRAVRSAKNPRHPRSN